MDALQRWARGLETRIKLLARRCILSAINDGNPVQTVSVQLFKGEECSGVERIQEYGFTSVPREGAQGIVLFLGGEGSHPVVIGVDDRRYRPAGLEAGDTMLYTDKEKDAGHHVHLVSADRTVRARGKNIVVHADDTVTIKAGKEIILDTPVTKCTGDIIDNTPGGGMSMAGMRNVYNSHVHPENDNGGPTGTPTQKMG